MGRFVKPRRPWACAKVSQTRPWVIECQCFGPTLLKHLFFRIFCIFGFTSSLFYVFFSGFTMLHNKPLAQIHILGKPLCISLILFIISLSFSVQRSVCFFLSKLGLGHTVLILVQREIKSLRCLWLETLRCKSIEALMSIGWLKLVLQLTSHLAALRNSSFFVHFMIYCMVYILHTCPNLM